MPGVVQVCGFQPSAVRTAQKCRPGRWQRGAALFVQFCKDFSPPCVWPVPYRAPCGNCINQHRAPVRVHRHVSTLCSILEIWKIHKRMTFRIRKWPSENELGSVPFSSVFGRVCGELVFLLKYLVDSTGGSLRITNSISLFVTGLLRFFVSYWVSFGHEYLSGHLSILCALFDLLVCSCPYTFFFLSGGPGIPPFIPDFSNLVFLFFSW